MSGARIEANNVLSIRPGSVHQPKRNGKTTACANTHSPWMGCPLLRTGGAEYWCSPSSASAMKIAKCGPSAMPPDIMSALTALVSPRSGR